MKAGIYYGQKDVRIEELETPVAGDHDIMSASELRKATLSYNERRMVITIDLLEAVEIFLVNFPLFLFDLIKILTHHLLKSHGFCQCVWKIW